MNPPCPQCVKYSADEEQLAANIAEYLAVIPEEIKTSALIYKERLMICAACSELRGGMCGECGCYVELRAAKKTLSCPVFKW